MPLCKYARPCYAVRIYAVRIKSRDGRLSVSTFDSCDYFFSNRMKLPCLFSKIGICLPFVACLTWLRM